MAREARRMRGLYPRSAERTPHPSRTRFARPCHPLPQGEREKSEALRRSRQSDRTRPTPLTNETRFMTDAPHISPLDQARILSEALPHMQQYDEETIVIKYGGHAMGAEDLAKAFARDIVLLEQTAIN